MDEGEKAMTKIRLKKILGLVCLVGICFSIPVVAFAGQAKEYYGYENRIESGSKCVNDGEYRCVNGDMIYRCESGKWRPHEICFWGCKDNRTCL